MPHKPMIGPFQKFPHTLTIITKFPAFLHQLKLLRKAAANCLKPFQNPSNFARSAIKKKGRNFNSEFLSFRLNYYLFSSSEYSYPWHDMNCVNRHTFPLPLSLAIEVTKDRISNEIKAKNGESLGSQEQKTPPNLCNIRGRRK